MKSHHFLIFHSTISKNQSPSYYANMQNQFKLILLLVFIMTAFIGCSKDKDTLPNLGGSWELRKSVNGLTGIATEHPAGNGTYLNFRGSEFDRFLDGKLIDEGTYTLHKYITNITKEAAYKIAFNNDDPFSASIYYTIKNDELVITVDAYDAPAAIYVKMQ